MTRCSMCGKPCIPMADWEPRAVCVHCDRDREAAIFLVHNPPKPRHSRAGRASRPAGQMPKWAADLPLSAAVGPGDPAAIAELFDALDSGLSRAAALARRRPTVSVVAAPTLTGEAR